MRIKMNVHKKRYYLNFNIFGKTCHGCRRYWSSSEDFMPKLYKYYYYCLECYEQVSHGIELKYKNKVNKFRYSNKHYTGEVHICKLCNKNEIKIIKRFTKDIYPKFCSDCEVKFKKMVEDDPKPTNAS